MVEFQPSKLAMRVQFPPPAPISKKTAQRSRNLSSADFQVCCVAGFQTRQAQQRPADWEIGDTAGLETCATVRRCLAAKFAAACENFLDNSYDEINAFMRAHEVHC